ncbi:alkyl hydroperoxide reductase subunit F [Clostridium sp. AL.422]|uniref:alkyl hydroperoxide reductase subunit F n=1 Tax=Clostridium TaxID=1485 RepID=UPI00293DB89D|nr:MULTISPECIES: alkyl hydroperoxide reductase subunit F [unclassified Clostridium]MDV4151127.1 alkyl hydroperoxide reductase subunit F [Clostridium sp. AL.422]
MLDKDIKQQLSTYIDMLENDIVIKKSIGDDTVSLEVAELIDEIAAMSPKIHVEIATLKRIPSFSINRMNEDTGVTFAGVPLGHEFSSLVLALLQVSGRPPKIDENIIKSIKSIDKDLNFETYISLSCHNCPDVVQALNLMSILNPKITHTMIDGESFQDEIDSRNIMAVPSIFLNGEHFDSGRTSLEEILLNLGQKKDSSSLNNKEIFDVLIVGGGPSGSSAAIYAARKGLKTGIVVERFGGQVMDTMAIENFISVQYTEGPKLSRNLEEHVKSYDVDIISSESAKSLTKNNDYIEIALESNASLKSKTVIISTGAKWRELGVPGEKEFKNKGVAYCPHCDGPIYKGKDIAVVGGGNSGIEAAIDLANIVKHVTVLEFLPELKADAVLQQKLNSLSNVTVLKNVQVKEITGTNKVNGITYIDRNTNEEKSINLEGIFVQIGLVPNTKWLGEALEVNRIGEIIVDKKGSTSLDGVFAAGDCTDSPYKQIIIAMGSGATASLAAFDYLIRNQK